MRKKTQIHTQRPEQVCAQILEDGHISAGQLASILEYHRHCLNTRGEMHYDDVMRWFRQVWEAKPIPQTQYLKQDSHPSTKQIYLGRTWDGANILVRRVDSTKPRSRWLVMFSGGKFTEDLEIAYHELGTCRTLAEIDKGLNTCKSWQEFATYVEGCSK